MNRLFKVIAVTKYLFETVVRNRITGMGRESSGQPGLGFRPFKEVDTLADVVIFFFCPGGGKRKNRGSDLTA